MTELSLDKYQVFSISIKEDYTPAPEKIDILSIGIISLSYFSLIIRLLSYSKYLLLGIIDLKRFVHNETSGSFQLLVLL
jgi:hypothetical protein